mgnify:CR=1 FL=1
MNSPETGGEEVTWAVNGCRDLLLQLGTVVDQIDPNGTAWEMRVMLAYSVYSISDSPRFEWRTVDIHQVQTSLESIKKFLQNYPIAIGLALFGLFLPYWFVANWGYAPRYSIHLLPLTIISLMLVGDYIFKRFSKNKLNLLPLS